MKLDTTTFAPTETPTKRFMTRLMIGALQPVFEAYPMVTAGEDKFMHLLIGSVLCGAGLGIVFSHNGSTGGTDILIAMLNKYLQRYFHSAICVLFAILGCLLGFSRPREQKLVNFVIGIGIVFGYYITLPFFDMCAEKGILSPYLTSTIQPIAILIAIL